MIYYKNIEKSSYQSPQRLRVSNRFKNSSDKNK